MHPMTVAVGSALAAIGIEPQPYKASKIIVSQLAITSGFHAVVGEVRRQQVLDVVRGAAFVGTLAAGVDFAAAVRRSRRDADWRRQYRQ